MHRNSGDNSHRTCNLRWIRVRRVATIVLAVLLFYYLSRFSPESYGLSREVLLVPTTKTAQPSCNETIPGLKDIFVILRTGANEALDRLPIHFNTTLRCLHNGTYGIWSDMEEVIGGHHVRNALDEIDPQFVATNPEFEYYRRLQEKGRSTFSNEELHEWATAGNGVTGRNISGWKLDKWKFLPIADKAYRQRPNAKWFVFIEADTYVSWTNLMRLLSKIDASKPYYMGREMQVGSDVFAYGGSGFVISQPALKKLVEYRAAKPGVYENLTARHWAGDCVLGMTLKDAGVDLSWQGANFFGRSPFQSNYGMEVRSSGRYLWCYYIATYHHVTPLDMDEIFRFEQKWSQEHSSLLRHRDVFRSLVLPKIGPRVEDWENVSEDDAGTKETFEACRQVCLDKAECLQFVFYQETQSCKTSNIIQVGHGRHREHQVVSGWIMERVDAFVRTMDRRCLQDPGDWILP